MKLNIKNNQESANVATMPAVNNNAAAIAEPIEDAVIINENQNENQQQPKAKGGSKKSPKGKKNPQPSTLDPQFCVITYTTKKGGTACYLAGFKTEADAKAMADQLPHSISNSYRYNDKGEKVFVVSFGTRYVDAATALCHALNNGDQKDIHKYIADCHEIYNAVVSSAKAEREANRNAKKAEDAKAKAKELAKVKKANGLYSMEEVAAMMQRAMAGEEVPELAAVKAALKAA